jgi:hypothetical protein
MKLNIDRAILRDIMETRATNERRNSYYVVGSIFSGMSFTMLLLGSDNYTAISALVMVGMMFYSCISCNKIDFEETDCGANGAGEKNKECDEQADAEEPYMKVDEMTLDEKINLFKELFYELSNIRLEDEELERMLTTVNYAEEEEVAEEEATEETNDKQEEEVPENPEKNTTEKTTEESEKTTEESEKPEEEDTKTRNMARAETYYSEGEPATTTTN